MARPNFLFIMSDDHSAEAVSSYGSRINRTPNIDRIAENGIKFENCFCTNSICAPSRATILTGKYSHLNGVKTLNDTMDGRQQTFPKLLQESGYQTAMIGKWHLGHGGINNPSGFDYWNVLPGQGRYHNPQMIDMGEEKIYQGYVTDVITDLSLEWLQDREGDAPFCLMCHHKAPHSPWQPDEKHAHMYEDEDIQEPESFDDDYSGHARAASVAQQRMVDLRPECVKAEPPSTLSNEELKKWNYQHFVKDYLRCVASLDDNVGRMLDFLEEEGLMDNTVVIYTSDQGFFLGEHGWYDKRFMYEESLRMPFVASFPEEIDEGSICEDIILNLDFAPTFLDYADIKVPEDIQGRSLRPLLRGEDVNDWRQSMYYRYWMHLAHHYVYAHYGIRTERYKLIYYYAQAMGASGAIGESKQPEWELFDLKEDPFEMNSLYKDPSYADKIEQLQGRLHSLRRCFKEDKKDDPFLSYRMKFLR